MPRDEWNPEVEYPPKRTPVPLHKVLEQGESVLEQNEVEALTSQALFIYQEIELRRAALDIELRPLQAQLNKIREALRGAT